MTAPNPLLRVRPAGSLIQGSLPTGCALCEAGTKLVLFVTGVCHYTCFYCPISSEKRMSTAAWANERKLDTGRALKPGSPEWDDPEAQDLKALAEEVRSIGAKGTGITGGDPLYDPERTLRYVRFLKRAFGPRHHVHLYTQIPFDPKWLKALQEAGLDELRFHPPDETWADPDAPQFEKYRRLWLEAKRMEDEGLWDVGFEIPCIPGSEEQMSALVGWLDRHRFRFINVNEMEFSETNYKDMLARGYRIKDTETSRALASEEVAREVMRRAASGELAWGDQPPQEAGGPLAPGARAPAKIAIHFCSSPFKDRVQLRQRLTRQAERTAKPYEVATEDGTLVRGVIECPDPAEMAEEILAAFGIAPDMLEVKEGAVHVAPWLLEEFAEEVPYPAYLSEVYPTATALEVERHPLNEHAETMPLPGRRVEVVEREMADLKKLGRPGQ